MKFAIVVQDAADHPLDQSLLDNLVSYNCRRVYQMIIADFHERMKKFEVRALDFSILSLLSANPNITQKRLSQAVNVAPPNLASLLDRLEERGLVVRQRNPLDKRSQTLALTSKGIRLCATAVKATSELESDATSMLTDSERYELLRLLQKISANTASRTG